jgi:hypothetical protein
LNGVTIGAALPTHRDCSAPAGDSVGKAGHASQPDVGRGKLRPLAAATAKLDVDLNCPLPVQQSLGDEPERTRSGMRVLDPRRIRATHAGNLLHAPACAGCRRWKPQIAVAVIIFVKDRPPWSPRGGSPLASKPRVNGRGADASMKQDHRALSTGLHT